MASQDLALLEEELTPTRHFEDVLEYLELQKSGTKKRSRRINETPRPPNMFILFRRERAAEIKRDWPNLKCMEVSKKVGSEWAALSPELKEVYKSKAEFLKDLHLQYFPNYKFLKRKPDSIKRRNTAMNEDKTF
jgi:hypothetical protein